MDRRSFLLSAGIVAAFTSIPAVRWLSPDKNLLITRAYSLWYNRPAVAEIPGGFCFGYVTSTGEVIVSNINERLSVRGSSLIHRYEGSSDHGSPSLLTIPSGKYAGHVIACFSKHATPLLFARTTKPGAVDYWGKSRVIDDGKSTYASLAALPDGRIILMHTLQDREGQDWTGDFRTVVVRTTADGGDTWSEPVRISGLGGGTFPYSTPLTVAADGRCAMTYAIYSTAKARHEGLTVVVTADAFQTKREIPVDLQGGGAVDTVPYETKWLSDDVVAVSYSQVSPDGKHGLSRIATVDVVSGKTLSNVSVAQVAVHTYAGGAAIEDGGLSVIYSPVAGGIVRKDLESGEVTTLIEDRQFSSPWQFTVNGQSMITALSNPLIKTTKVFGADIFIMHAA